MATYLIPLSDILTDPDRPLDLTALPAAEAVERIKQTYGYWGPLLDVRIEGGIAVITLPDENANKAGAALDKIAQAARAGRAGHYQQAQTLYADALKILPQHTEARRELAMVQIELGNSAAAKQNLIRVLQLDPKDAWAYLILGNLYFNAERDLGSAERYIAAAADLAPDDPYILNSYAGLQAARGHYDDAAALYERAIAAGPNNAAPYLGLATVADRRQDSDGTLAALERLFALPASADARSEPLYEQARRLYARARLLRAERDSDAALAAVDAALAAYQERTGIEIRLRYDRTLAADAVTRLAWRYNQPYHEIILAGGGANPYLIAYSLARILVEDEDRAAGESRSAGGSRGFVTNEATEAAALQSIDRDLRKQFERQRRPAAGMEEFGLSLVRTLLAQLYNTPFDFLIQRRLYADFPAVRDAQFVGLARQMEENARIAVPSPARDAIPPRLWQKSAAINAALALFVDDLYAGRTAYAAAYAPAGVLDVAARLHDLHRDLALPDKAGAGPALVDLWAAELGVTGWYTWRDTGPIRAGAGALASASEPGASETGASETGASDEPPIGHRTTPEADARRVGGPTNPAYLERPEVQQAAVLHLLSALRRFSRLESAQVLAIAAEIALLGADGIDYTPGRKQYRLRALPGEQFTGLELLCLEYAGLKLTRPEIDTQIPFDDAWAEAKAAYDAGE